MSYCCYIIYSKSQNNYYVGYTSDIKERLVLHNEGHFGNKSYTNRTSDWEVFLEISCEAIEQAIFVEKTIKRMKSRRYIENLKKYPELVNRIKDNYHTKPSE